METRSMAPSEIISKVKFLLPRAQRNDIDLFPKLIEWLYVKNRSKTNWWCGILKAETSDSFLQPRWRFNFSNISINRTFRIKSTIKRNSKKVWLTFSRGPLLSTRQQIHQETPQLLIVRRVFASLLKLRRGRRAVCSAQCFRKFSLYSTKLLLLSLAHSLCCLSP